MAEIAFVIDIRGVCSSRETRVMTPRPMNVASMNTNSMLTKSVGGAAAWAVSAADTACCPIAARIAAARTVECVRMSLLQGTDARRDAVRAVTIAPRDTQAPA